MTAVAAILKFICYTTRKKMYQWRSGKRKMLHMFQKHARGLEGLIYCEKIIQGRNKLVK